MVKNAFWLVGLAKVRSIIAYRAAAGKSAKNLKSLPIPDRGAVGIIPAQHGRASDIANAALTGAFTNRISLPYMVFLSRHL
jgi:hypothetical protein